MRYVMLTMLLTVSAAHAETAIIYDGESNLAGTVMSAGPKSNFIYGRDGELVGSTARAGNSTFFYGSDGSYVGQAVNNGRSRFDD